MADLMESLIYEGSRASRYSSSQESFHSMGNNNEIVSSPSSSKTVTGNDTPGGTTTTTATPDPKFGRAAGNAIPIDEFLAAQIQLPHLKSNNGSITLHQQPVELNKTTSQYISRLYETCRAKCLDLAFELTGDNLLGQAFGGTLRIGTSVVITLPEECRSKKEAKERLAEQGLRAVEGMEGQEMGGAGAGAGGAGGGGMMMGDVSTEKVNWVGKLLEYHQYEYGTGQSPTYTFHSLGLSFACTCTLAAYPDKVFGASTTPFSDKKQAQRNAAAGAVHFLIDEGKLNPDGSTLSRKKAKNTPFSNAAAANGGGGSGTGAANTGMATGKAVKWVMRRDEGAAGGTTAMVHVLRDSGFVQRVADISPLLGFQAPQYHLSPTSPQAPNLLSGYATFANNAFLPDAVGEVRNVFGKKNAKAEIAKGAWDSLTQVASKRGVGVIEV